MYSSKVRFIPSFVINHKIFSGYARKIYSAAAPFSPSFLSSFRVMCGVYARNVLLMFCVSVYVDDEC